MSLYLGKDNANTNILHLTKGTNSEAAMRSGIQSNTVFHSTLPFISVALSNIGTLTYMGSEYSYNNNCIRITGDGYLYLLSIPSELLTYFRTEKKPEPFAFLTFNMFSYDDINSRVRFLSPHSGISPSASRQYFYTNSSGHISPRENATHLLIGSSKPILNVFIIRLATLPSLSGPINISSQVFTIGSYDLRNYRFLGSEDTNNYDPILNMPGFSKRIINSTGHVGNQVSIVSSPNHEIHFGGNRVFSTGVSIPERVKQVYSFSSFFPLSSYRSGTGTRVYSATINSNLTVGDIYAIGLCHSPFMDYVEPGEASTFRSFTGSLSVLIDEDSVHSFAQGPGAPPDVVYMWKTYLRESGSSLILEMHIAGYSTTQSALSFKDTTINGYIYHYTK